MFTPKLFVSSGKSKHLGVDEYLFNENKVCATTLKDSNKEEEEEHNDNNDGEKEEKEEDDDNELMNIYSTLSKFVRRHPKTPAQHFYLCFFFKRESLQQRRYKWKQETTI